MVFYFFKLTKKIQFNGLKHSSPKFKKNNETCELEFKLNNKIN